MATKNKNRCLMVNKLHPVVLQSRHINYRPLPLEQKTIILLELQGSSKYGGLSNRQRYFIIVIGTWDFRSWERSSASDCASDCASECASASASASSTQSHYITLIQELYYISNGLT